MRRTASNADADADASKNDSKAAAAAADDEAWLEALLHSKQQEVPSLIPAPARIRDRLPQRGHVTRRAGMPRPAWRSSRHATPGGGGGALLTGPDRVPALLRGLRCRSCPRPTPSVGVHKVFDSFVWM